MMNPEELRARTRSFSLCVVKLVQTLPKNMIADVIGKQVLRSATSVGANYRAACRAQSGAMFFAKLSIVVEEADETVFWLELLRDTGFIQVELMAELLDEAEQILKIMASSRKTAKLNR
jgi:four helix bundle protein